MTSNSFFKYIVIVKTCSDIFYTIGQKNLLYAVCLSVCCLFIFIYIFVSRSFPLPSAFLSTDIERGKVFGLNTLRRRKIPTETACRPDLSTFKG